MASSVDLRMAMEGFGITLLIAACFTPFFAETERDRWMVSFPSFMMALVGVMLIVLS